VSAFETKSPEGLMGHKNEGRVFYLTGSWNGVSCLKNMSENGWQRNGVGKLMAEMR